MEYWETEMLKQKEGGKYDADLPLVMNVIARASSVKDKACLLSLLNRDAAKLFHHDSMICGYQVLSSSGSYAHNFLQHNYPAGYAEALAKNENRSDSPLFQKWRSTLEPVMFQLGRDDAQYSTEWVNVFRQYGLHNTIGHGILDVRGTFGSYFIFSRLPGEVGSRELFLLKLITPHLHLALMRTIMTDQKFGKPAAPEQEKNLSARQQEILHCINQGKTNKEIALLLSMTEKNVKYHVEQIFLKLGVRSRAQAVSKGLLL